MSIFILLSICKNIVPYLFLHSVLTGFRHKITHGADLLIQSSPELFNYVFGAHKRA